MDLLYPDYDCFQRGFDDPSQIRIRMEALACEEIFLMAEDKRIEMVWSFMHEMKPISAPFPIELTKFAAYLFSARESLAPRKKYVPMPSLFSN